MPQESGFPGADFFTRPNVARVYDVLAGGCDNFQADRDEAERLLKACPELRSLVAENRAFLERAVTWTATSGVTQFADLGSGLPLYSGRGKPRAPEIHETVRAVNPAARCVYVDDDPVVLVHSRVMRAHVRRGENLEPAQGVAVAEADLRSQGNCSGTRRCSRSSTRPGPCVSSSAWC